MISYQNCLGGVPGAKFVPVRPLILALTTVSSLWVSPVAYAGELSSFEKSASQESKSENSANLGSTVDANKVVNTLEDDSGAWKLVFALAAMGGMLSLAQVNPSINERMNSESSTNESGTAANLEDAAFKIAPRKPGKPLLPFARIDYAYQRISSDVSARDYRGEFGYGPLALHINQTHFIESNPDDTLDLRRTYLLYRMSLGEMVEIDAGLGVSALIGSGRSNQSVWTFPVLVQATDTIGVEFRPAWEDSLSDYDLGLVFSYRYVSLKTGYRWFVSPDKTLSGLYAGISLHY